jgi:hypothetical protein
MRYTFPPNVDRTFVVEALRAAADRFEYLAREAEERSSEHYDIKRSECLRLAGDLEVDK